MSFGFSSSFQPRQPRRWWCPTGPGSLRDMDVSGQRRPPVSLPDHSGEVITARGCLGVFESDLLGPGHRHSATSRGGLVLMTKMEPFARSRSSNR